MGTIPTDKDMHPDDAFLLLIGRRFVVDEKWDDERTIFTINAPHKNRSLIHESAITYKEKGVEQVNTGYSRLRSNKYCFSFCKVIFNKLSEKNI